MPDVSGKHARERGEPLERSPVIGVVVAGLDDLVEVRERRGVEPHLIEGLAHEELGALHVLRVVAALLVEHLLELDRGGEVILLVVELDRALERLARRRRRRVLRLHLEAALPAFFAAGVGVAEAVRHRDRGRERDERQLRKQAHGGPPPGSENGANHRQAPGKLSSRRSWTRHRVASRVARSVSGSRTRLWLTVCVVTRTNPDVRLTCPGAFILSAPMIRPSLAVLALAFVVACQGNPVGRICDLGTERRPSSERGRRGIAVARLRVAHVPARADCRTPTRRWAAMNPQAAPTACAPSECTARMSDCDRVPESPCMTRASRARCR